MHASKRYTTTALHGAPVAVRRAARPVARIAAGVAAAALVTLGGPARAQSPLPYLPDFNLQECLVGQAAANGWQFAEDVISLSCPDRGVVDVDGIEQLPNLSALDLSDNEIVMVGPLGGLGGLTTLRLSGNAGIDVSTLVPVIDQNPGLVRLGLGDIHLGPYLPWFQIPRAQVRELDLRNTGLMELWGIEAYQGIEVLDLSENDIADLDPLGSSYYGPLTALRELDLSDNRIVDVGPLAGFGGLTTLRVSGNPGIDFYQLQPILGRNPGLTRIGLGGIQLGPYLPWLDIQRGQIVELDLAGTGLTELWGIEEFTSIEVLDLSGNRIENLHALGSGPFGPSTSLRELDLSNNRVTDVGPLAVFTGLTTLRLSGNADVDFAQLQPILNQNVGLTRLGLAGIALGPYLPWLDIQRDQVVELDLARTGLTDLWGIDEFTALRALDASGNDISELLPLSGGYYGPLEALRELDLSDNRIADVAPLSSVGGLETLRLSGNGGIDLTALLPILERNDGLTRIGLGGIRIGPYLPWLDIRRERVVELDVSSTGLMELWGIEAYRALEVLEASGNGIGDLSPLGHAYPTLASLRVLDLADNNVTDVRPLASFNRLETLRLSGNGGVDFGHVFPIIEQNQGLTRLGLGDIHIGSYLPWFNIPRERVVELDLSNTGLMELWGIEEYVALESLDASRNRLGDLMPFGGYYYGTLESLRELDLSDNQIQDIAPLAPLTALETLRLSGNSGIDFAQLRPILSQNQGLTRLGLGGIALGQHLPWLEIRRERVVELDVSDSGLEWLWGLEEYSALEILDASGNQISDLMPIGGYYGYGEPLALRVLDLSDNLIGDVGPLQNLATLGTLRLSGNPDIDFPQLMPIIERNAGLIRLGLGDISIGPYVPWLGQVQAQIVELDVSNTGLMALWGIEQFTALEDLDASRNAIADVTPLSGYYGPMLESLRALDLSDNQIVDVLPLQTFWQLTSLRLSGNAGIDFGQVIPILEQNQGLTRIGLADIQIGPYLPWLSIPRERVVELDLESTGLTALSGIEAYVGLETLDVSGNLIDDLMPLGGGWFGPMAALRELDLADNLIADIMPLYGLTSLGEVILSGNDGVPCYQVYQLESILGPDAVTGPAGCP